MTDDEGRITHPQHDHCPTIVAFKVRHLPRSNSPTARGPGL